MAMIDSSRSSLHLGTSIAVSVAGHEVTRVSSLLPLRLTLVANENRDIVIVTMASVALNTNPSRLATVLGSMCSSARHVAIAGGSSRAIRNSEAACTKTLRP